MYQDRYLDILPGYGVGPPMICILWTFWNRLRMVVKVDRYFGPHLQLYCEVTQGNHLSPTVFNVVVDTVIHHWVMVVLTLEAEAEVLVETIQEFVDFLYTDEGLFELPIM